MNTYVKYSSFSLLRSGKHLNETLRLYRFNIRIKADLFIPELSRRLVKMWLIKV